MSISVAVFAFVLVLASVSAIVQARKGRWWTAAGTFLPCLGGAAMLGDMKWHSLSLFWLSVVLMAAGFGAEGMAWRKARTPKDRWTG